MQGWIYIYILLQPLPSHPHFESSLDNAIAGAGDDNHNIMESKQDTIDPQQQQQQHNNTSLDTSTDVEKGTETATTTNGRGTVKKGKIRTGDKDNEEIIIPKNRLVIVFIGLMLTVFLAALDQTIVCIILPSCAHRLIFVATALPTIVQDLQGGENYSWVGTSYLLASAAFTPMYGQCSNLFGRKPMLYGSILLFLFGSALCGAAQSITVLKWFKLT